MDIYSVKKNLREKGLIKTAGIFLKRSGERRENERIADKIFEGLSSREYAPGDFTENSGEILKDMSAAADAVLEKPSLIENDDVFGYFHRVTAYLAENRDCLLETVPSFVEGAEGLLRKLDGEKKYKYAIKRKYIKGLIPRAYGEKSKEPLCDKVIFMENGSSPSPSGFLLAKTLEEQGKYDVHYTGLGIRAVPWAEYYENALRYVEDLATARAVFLSTANDILSQFDLRPETKLIQLWHGVGVFKKVGYSTIDNDKFGKSLAARKEYDQYRNYDYVTIAAEEQTWIFQDAMHLEKEKIVPVGVARTDVFFDREYIESTYDKLHEEYPLTKGKKIILYAPTFRGTTSDAKAPDRLDVSVFAERLSDEYVLLIKHHGLAKDVPPIPAEFKDTFCYDLGESGVLGIERLLAIADICITDYSSIAFEFAIMERPLIFFAYDLDEYIDERGLYYDYDEITPGPVVKTNEEMVEYIADIDNRFDREEIAKFRKKHVGACDGHAVERTIQLI